MLKVFCVFIVNLMLLGCQVLPTVELDQIDGYWEIQLVQQQNETFKSKQTNLLYDFYSTENNIGIYKKVAPQIDGSFQTSKSAVSFEIIKDNGDFMLQFSSPWNTWVKKVKHLDSEKLVLFNEERSFHYRRPVISKIPVKNE